MHVEIAPEPVHSAQFSPHRRWPGEVDHTNEVLAMLASWTELDEARIAFTKAAVGPRGSAVDWAAVRRWLDEAGVTPEAGARTVPLGRAWRGSSATSTDKIAASKALLEYWMLCPCSEFIADVVRWSVICEEWESLSAIWMRYLIPSGGWRDPDIVELLAGLPADGRATAPMLSVAWAHARAELSGRASRASEVRRNLISDATELHANWRQAASVEAAVQAGTLWMLLQRIAPGSAPDGGLAAASATQASVAELIERQRNAGWPPSRATEAIFRAASAHAALALGDYSRTISEADYCLALSHPAGSMIAGGTGALARELAGWVESIPERGEPGGTLDDCPVDLVGPDLTAGRLAAALAALRELDRDGCRRHLADIGTLSTGASRWTVLAWVTALEAAIWGDPAEALRRLDAEATRHSMVSVEARERLGAAMLGRARADLLAQLGARSAAVKSAERIEGSLRWVAHARALLWAGDLEASGRVAEEGQFDPATSHIDRLVLRVIHAAVLALTSYVPGEREPRIAEVVGECLERRTLLPIALLPKPAVDALIRGFLATDPGLDQEERILLSRLEGLDSGAGAFVTQVRLTRRERSLLPMLAGDEAVPEIAARLHLSPHTVRKQVVTLRQKYAARNRSELVRLAREAGDL
jgi:DNA-binding CsgD family transcriptional regulator